MDAIRNIGRTFVPVMLTGLVMLAGGASISSSTPLVIVPVHQQHQQAATLALVNGPALPQSMRRQCAQEDSVDCWWNDGGGHPFVVRQFPGRAMLTCWMFEVKRYAARHDYCISESRRAPSTITCDKIVSRAGYEFPREAGRVAGICLVDRYRGARWSYVGRYDRHRNVWRMTGATSVFFNGQWFETS